MAAEDTEDQESGERSWRPPESFDEYRLIRLLGRGGMGEVYLAHDTLLDRPVAVKFIGGLCPDAEAREQFLTEARAAARLQHPNVVTIHRVGELDGRPFLISEFVQGQSLEAMEKPMAPERALEIGIGLSRGLAAAHRRGVLHRDIKPGNAIVTEKGEVKILDFGLAALVDPAEWLAPGEPPPPSARERGSLSPPRVSMPPEGADAGGGTLRSDVDAEPPGGRGRTPRKPDSEPERFVGGTPHYMAPELWIGQSSGYRSDVYALGVVLFELMTGKTPFMDAPLSKLPFVVRGEDARPLASLVPGADARLAAIVDRCLARDPAERFPSGEELRDALEELTTRARPHALPEGNPYRGLLAFDAEHRALFFGRSSEIGTVVDRLRAEPLLVVAGDSGLGKSSLCAAGVVPAVVEGALGEGRDWRAKSLTPGKHPVAALAGALSDVLGLDEEGLAARMREAPGALGRELRRRLGVNGGLLLYVDQLEELVTLSVPEEAQIASELLGQLATRIPGVRLLATVRSDYIARVATLPSLGTAVLRALYILCPLAPHKIREAIVGPARAKGVRFESEELVDKLVASTGAAEGLPLLQFALAELWDARAYPADIISAEALDAIGGVAGALARHADHVVFGLPPEERRAARRILTSLVTLEGTRAKATEEELALGESGLRALEALVRGRLLVAHEGEEGAVYEIAHEALIKGWGALRGWLDQHQEARVVRRRLGAAATEWARLGRAREALWGERQIAESNELEVDDLDVHERTFLEASRKHLRRRQIARRGLAVGIPALALTLLVGVRMAMRRDVDRSIQARVRDASALLEEARHQDAEMQTLRRRAFDAFDGKKLEEGEATWAQARALETEVDRRYGRASQVLEAALVLDGERQDVRQMLGDALLARAFLAEQGREMAQRDDLLARMALYDTDGRRMGQWHLPARLSIATNPPGALVVLERYAADVEEGRRPLVERRELGTTPTPPTIVAPGSYLISIVAPERALVRYPMLLGRGEERSATVELPLLADIPPGFVYIPAGRFLFGTALDESKRRGFLGAVPVHEVETGAYLIARHEVTYGDWIEYLRALPPEERARRTPGVGEAALGGGLGLRETQDGGYQLFFKPVDETYAAPSGRPFTYPSRAARSKQDWLRFPVTGISLNDGEAYAAWLDRTGRVRGARLCSEVEWERAARGADDREFPHGDALEPGEANFDETYAKVVASMGPDEVGSFPATASPFGVFDMAGNVYEWTLSSLEPGKSVVRGGAYFYDAMTARSTNRTTLERSLRDTRVGLRLCAEAPAPGGAKGGLTKTP
ncbi:bifunctional serine/threonine-protein kinase/formylglycine-generating enzyme family protein [Polyangium aurulentum]|uniref:bifunctional serine/threonine-protein kinase/formylglycine-generating enzyme family protein n=1 Tax=Polyangium aurulentum TaxID=2567896 RepID=UPI001F3B2D53|nr:bifunctional serine/threonine-protein kinase/formylglycine-generating enzyme family protein [Polyangium aurulentum]